jgi:hypothetical protein
MGKLTTARAGEIAIVISNATAEALCILKIDKITMTEPVINTGNQGTFLIDVDSVRTFQQCKATMGDGGDEHVYYLLQSSCPWTGLVRVAE